MAGGKITRIVGGINSIECDTWTVYTDKFTAYANNGSHFTADGGTNFGEPKDPPPTGKYFVKGWWTDENDKPIKEATIGETIRFHLQTQNIPDGKDVNFTVYDWDGLKILNDKLKLTDKTTKQESTTIKITNNKGFVEWTTGEGSRTLLDENFEGLELELFVECSYNGEIIPLPEAESDYLLLYEKEVLITVLVELPHSHYSLGRAAKNLDMGEAFSALGLAGHSAMAIGDRYFDFGPDNSPGTYSEKDYDVDFNDDGDKIDVVYIDSPSYMNAPGRPWWGEMVAKRHHKNPIDVKLNEVLNFISLHWEKDGTNIYGEVHKTEFYVKESEANKMIKWWEERYKHLKIYSVFPWTGEQCTTAVKTAIQQAFPFEITKLLGGKNWLPDTTQMPSGLLEDLRPFISTSKQHSGQLAKSEIIKKEANDYPTKP